MKKWKFLLPAAGIVAIGAIAASIYCSQTEYGNEYIIDQQGNKVVDQGFKDVYYEWDCPEKKAQYMISNRWPKWSPFYKEKWGFINLETKTVEAPRFSDKLRYRDDGLAWDYKGHLIDKGCSPSFSLQRTAKNTHWSIKRKGQRSIKEKPLAILRSGSLK